MKPQVVNSTNFLKQVLLFGVMCMLMMNFAEAADVATTLGKLSKEIFGYVSTVAKVILGLVLLGVAYMMVKEPERLKEHSFKTGCVIAGCLIATFAEKISETIFDSMK